MIPGIIIVLGSPNDEYGGLFSVAIERGEAARQLLAGRPGWKLLLTGGFGAHFNTTDKPHAYYLQRWLQGRGVADEVFLPWALSRNTLEDASLARPIVAAAGTTRAVVVTSDYHLDRARLVFEREFAGTTVAWEFVATCTDESRSRLDLAALRKHEREALARLKKLEAGDAFARQPGQ